MMEKDVNGKTNFDCSVEFQFSRSRKLGFMSSLYLYGEKCHPSISVMVYVISDFVLKKNIYRVVRQ